MKTFANLEHFAHVSAWGKCNYKHGVFGYDSVCVALSVLVSWEIRTTCMLCVTRSVRTSSSGTLGGIPFSTSRG